MYCKAGFYNCDPKDCEHVVIQTVAQRGFQLADDFYSKEAIAARREANKQRYTPKAGSYSRHAGKIAADVNRGEG